MQGAINAAHEAVDRVADQTHRSIGKAGERATEAYGRAAGAVDDVAQTVGPLIRQNPYLALGAVAAFGLILGLVFAPRRREIIYLKPAP